MLFRQRLAQLADEFQFFGVGVHEPQFAQIQPRRAAGERGNQAGRTHAAAANDRQFHNRPACITRWEAKCLRFTATDSSESGCEFVVTILRTISSSSQPLPEPPGRVVTTALRL